MDGDFDVRFESSVKTSQRLKMNSLGHWVVYLGKWDIIMNIFYLKLLENRFFCYDCNSKALNA